MPPDIIRAPGRTMRLPRSKAANRSSAIVKFLEEKKIHDKTDIIITSDHGFSTIARGFYLADILKSKGFSASKKFDVRSLVM